VGWDVEVVGLHRPTLHRLVVCTS